MLNKQEKDKLLAAARDDPSKFDEQLGYEGNIEEDALNVMAGLADGQAASSAPVSATFKIWDEALQGNLRILDKMLRSLHGPLGGPLGQNVSLMQHECSDGSTSCDFVH